MIATIKQRHCDINYWIASEYSTIKGFPGTIFYRWNIFSGDSSTLNLVHKLKTASTLPGFNSKPDVTVLPFTTRLAHKFALSFHRYGNCFPVCHLRLTNIHPNVKFAQYAVD